MPIDPITRREMFMAKAAGQNVNVPEPITREEMFLKHMADNSVSKYFGESMEVLFDQRVEITDLGTFIGAMGIPFSEALESGKHYEVTFNGSAYSCTAVATSEEQTALGNLGIAGLEDTGEPFLFLVNKVVSNGNVSFEATLVVINAVPSATVKIEKSVIHTIDPKYLPETGAGFNVNVWYESGEYVSDKTYEEVKAAEEAKTPIVGTFTLHDGKVFTMIGCDFAATTVNFLAFNLNNTPEIGVYHVSIDANDFTNIAFWSITATQGGMNDIYPK